MGKLWRVRGIGVFSPARPMSQQINAVSNVSRLLRSLFTLRDQEPRILTSPSYNNPLGMYSRLWRKGANISSCKDSFSWSNPAQITPGSYTRGSHRCIHIYIGLGPYHWVCFQDRASASCGVTGGCDGKAVPRRRYRIEAACTLFNPSTKEHAFSRLI